MVTIKDDERDKSKNDINEQDESNPYQKGIHYLCGLGPKELAMVGIKGLAQGRAREIHSVSVDSPAKLSGNAVLIVLCGVSLLTLCVVGNSVRHDDASAPIHVRTRG